MVVTASVDMRGVTKEQFTAVQETFKLALSKTVACAPDKIRITKIEEVPERRRALSSLMAPFLMKKNHSRETPRMETYAHLAVRALAGTRLVIEFEIVTSSPEVLKSTEAILQGTTNDRSNVYRYRDHDVS